MWETESVVPTEQESEAVDSIYYDMLTEVLTEWITSEDEETYKDL